MHTPWWKRWLRDPLYRFFHDFRLRRRLRFWWQRRTRGWDDSETWSLDAEIARWALPRLRRFRELPHGFWTETEAETEAILDEIEWFLSVHASEDGTWQLTTPELRERYNLAAAAFGANFGHLWS